MLMTGFALMHSNNYYASCTGDYESCDYRGIIHIECIQCKSPSFEKYSNDFDIFSFQDISLGFCIIVVSEH